MDGLNSDARIDAVRDFIKDNLAQKYTGGENMNQIKTGEYIRLLRKEHGMTQAELAKKLCVSDKTVSKWECGAGSPDISMFPELSGIFGIDVQSLFRGEALKNKQINGSTNSVFRQRKVLLV